jgi:hypothetical protein
MLGRQFRMSYDNITLDITETGYRNIDWTHQADVTFHCVVHVNMVTNIQVSKKVDPLLPICATVSQGGVSLTME